MKSINKSVYCCEVCGKEFESEDKVLQHELFHKDCQRIENLYKSGNWYWFVFKFKNDSKVYKYFIYKIYITTNYKSVELYNYSSNDCFSLSDIDIIDILSPMEMYEKYGSIVDTYFRSTGYYGGKQSFLERRKGMSLQTAREIDETYRLYKEKEVKNLIESNTPEQLALMILKNWLPEIDGFSFEQFVKGN